MFLVIMMNRRATEILVICTLVNVLQHTKYLFMMLSLQPVQVQKQRQLMLQLQHIHLQVC